MQNFYSKDFYFSAFLIVEGFQLKSHFREKGYTTFVFENCEDIQSLANTFYSLNTKIEPIKYSQAIRALKGVIHSSVSTSTRLNNNESFTIQKVQ